MDYSLASELDGLTLPEVGLQPPVVLKKARRKLSTDGTLSDTVKPGQAQTLPQAAARYRQRGAELYDEATRMADEQPDMTGIQEYAKQRSGQGDAAMLNALAAQFAGERFEPVQAQFLKRAAAARDPIKAGNGFVTPDGQYVQDPTVGRERKLEALMNQAKAYEQMALNAQTQQERLDAQRAQAETNSQLKLTLAAMKAQGGGGSNAQPYYQPVQAADALFAFNARTGKVEPVMGPNGQPIVGAPADPRLQGEIARAKAGGTEAGKSNAEADFNAPKVVQQGEETIKLVDDLLKAPGFKQAVGLSRVMGIQNIPGTAAKDFDIRLEQLLGKQFLAAFDSLRGGGQITVIEGEKATNAISRMRAAASEEEFIKAAREFQGIMRIGVERARQRMQAPGAAMPNTSTQPAQRPRIRFDAQGNQIP